MSILKISVEPPPVPGLVWSRTDNDLTVGQPFLQHRLSFVPHPTLSLQLQDLQPGQGEAGGEEFGGQGAHLPGVGYHQETKALQCGDPLQ